MDLEFSAHAMDETEANQEISKRSELFHQTTGHTMRRCRWRKSSSGGRWRTSPQPRTDHARYKHQFSICKVLKTRDQLFEDEKKAIFEEFSCHVDDGGLEAVDALNSSAKDTKWNAWESLGGTSPIIYSLNKRKRWLIAEDLRNFATVEDRYQNVDFKVVLVERELTTNTCDMHQKNPRPDCIRICESKTNLPEVVPNQKYSLVTDLRLKSKGLCDKYYNRDEEEERDLDDEEEDVELYYEICYPRATENCNWRRETHDVVVHCTDKNDRKPVSKKKGQKVKRFSYWHGLSDPKSWADEVQNRFQVGETEEELFIEDEDLAVPQNAPSLGCVVAQLLKRPQKRHKERKRKRKHESDSNNVCFVSNTNLASSSPVKMHGKNATIYEENEDYNNTLANNNSNEEDTSLNNNEVSVSMETHISVDDVRPCINVKLVTETIAPCHLSNMFGSTYIESISQPRRFAVDISQRLNGTVPDTTRGKVYALFEVYDRNNNTVECLDWNHSREAEWETLDNYTHLRVTLIISSAFMSVDESDLILDTVKAIQTPEDVIHWLICVLKQKMQKNEKGPIMKKSKYSISMDTVTNASGWKLKMDTPEGVYQDITENETMVHATENMQEIANTIEFGQFCGICYETLSPADGGVNGSALQACGHWFCNECWNQHLRSRVRQGYFRIICPAYDCKSAVDIVTKMSLMSTCDFHRHLDHTRDAAIIGSREWQWCPNPKCGRMACVVAGTGSVPVHCVCGWLWCSLCMQDAHWPSTCKQAAQYRKTIQKFKAAKKQCSPIITVEVKRCPKCNYPIEKNGGCPQMDCRMCGKSFCWKCLSSWGSHDWMGIHLRCPRAQESLETLYLEERKKSSFLFSQVALHHRELRRKSLIQEQQINAYKLIAKQFLKEPVFFDYQTSTLQHLISPSDMEHLPITWTSSESRLFELMENASQGQECVRFCFEAHFVLEFLAVYISDRSVRKKQKKPIEKLAERLEFITGRLDELISARSNFDMIRFHTQAGKLCIKQLAEKIKNTQTVTESK